MLKNNLKINISKNFLFCICLVCLIFTSFGMVIEDSVAVELNESVSEMGSDIDIQLENSQAKDILEVDNQDSDVLAAQITVNGNRYSDIKTAVNNANPQDTIKLSGTYYASDNESYITVNKPLHFVGSGSAVLDGRNLSHAFHVLEGAKGTTFKDIKFINGYAFTGSAIHVGAKNVVVENCVFEKNKCNRSGAIYTAYDLETAENLLVKNCRFVDNSGYRDHDKECSGAALSVYGKNTVVTDCIFESNYVRSDVACYGGAIQVGLDKIGSKVVVSNCIFKNNRAISSTDCSHGGAGCVRNGTEYKNCTFINNSASEGGALTFHASGLISNCTFINNSATLFGGALSTGYQYDTMDLKVENCNFEGNRAPDGGAVQAKGLNIQVVDSNFTKNHATNCGGAINIIAENVKVENDNFKNNTADIDGGAIFINGQNTIIRKSLFTSNHAIPDYDKSDDGLGGAIYVKSTLTNIISNDFEYNTARNGSAIYYDSLGENLILMGNTLFENQAWVYQLPISCEDIYYGDSETINVTLYGGNNIAKFNNLAVSNAIYNGAGFECLDIDGEVPVSGATDDGRLYQDSREYNMQILLTVTHEDGTMVYNKSSNSSYLGEISVNLNNLKPGKYFVTAKHFEDTYYKGITNVSSFNVIPKVDNKITVSTNASSFDFEDVVIWTVNITNLGPNNSTGVIAYNVIPEGLILLNHTFGDRYDPKTGALNISELDVGEILTYTVITVVNKIGEITNEVNITANELDVNMDNNFDETVINVNPASDIAVDKVSSNRNPNYMEYFNWTITVTNNGPDTAHNVSVSDILPDSLIFISCDGDWDENTGIWNVGTLENGQSARLTIQCQINRTGLAQNNVTATASEFDYDLSNNHDEEIIYTNPSSDLAIKKEVNASSANYLDIVKWALTISNNGPDNATDVIVRDVLPEGFIYISSTHDYANGGFVIEQVNVGEIIVIEIVSRANATGNFVNVANVTSDNYDYDLTNNEDDENITVNPASDLFVSKSVDESNPKYHDTVIWTIEVRNNGPDTAHNITIKDLLPGSLVWLGDDSSGKYDPLTGKLDIESLEVGEEFTLNIECMVNATGPIQNNVSVNCSEYDYNLTNNKDNETIDVEKTVDVSVVKLVNNTSPNYRELVTWTLIISNDGPDKATDVYVEDALPEGLILVSYTATKGIYDNGLWAMCCLEKGEEQRLEIITRVVKTGKITNLAVIHADEYDSNLTNNQDNESVDVPLSADVEVRIRVNNTEPLFGEEVKWTVIVRNNGPDGATNVILNEILPDGLVFVDCNPTKGTYSDGQWNIGSLKVGEEQCMDLTTISNSVGKMENNVDVDCDEYDWNMSNNRDNAAVNVKPVADLSVTKIASKYRYSVGDVIEYEIEVVNNGPNTARNIKVSELLDDSLKFKSFKVTMGRFDKKSLTWTIDSLNYGESARLIIKAIAISSGILNNSVVVTSDAFDPDLDNNNDFAVVNVTDIPSDEVSKNLKTSKNVISKNPSNVLEKHVTANPFWSLIGALVFSLIFLDSRILKRR